MKKILKGDRAGRLRPKTSRPRKLNMQCMKFWRYVWERSRVLPNEQYIEFQIAAAGRFGRDRSTISRWVDKLVGAGAVIEVRKTYRDASGFFTSRVIQPTEPPPDDEIFDTPCAKLHRDQVVENKESASMCKNAPLNTVYDYIPTNNSYRSTDYMDSSTTTTTVSGARMHADQVAENKPSLSSAKMHTVKANLGTQILAARQQLAAYETAAQRTMTQFGNDGGWDRSIEKQRAEVIRLEAELAGVTNVKVTHGETQVKFPEQVAADATCEVNSGLMPTLTRKAGDHE